MWGIGAALFGALLVGFAAVAAFIIAAALIYRKRHRNRHFNDRHNDVSAFLEAVKSIDDSSTHSTLTRRRVPFHSGKSNPPSSDRLAVASVELTVVAGVPNTMGGEHGGSDSGIEFGEDGDVEDTIDVLAAVERGGEDFVSNVLYS